MNDVNINRTFSAAFLLLAMAAGTLHAQTKALSVKQGAEYKYESKISLEQTVSMAGTESATNGTVTSSPVLRAEKVAKSSIAWACDPGSNHLQMSGEMLPGGKLDTTVNFIPSRFSTDLRGSRIASDSADMGKTLSAVIGGPAFNKLFDTWFSPVLARDVKPGGSWDEQHVDTVVNGMIGIQIKTATTTHYTYDGLVDTLGGKYMRVRTKVTSMTIAGSGSFGGMNMVIDGDGTCSSDLYYTAADGILKVSNIDCLSNYRMAVNGDGQMVIPVSQRVTGSMVRK